MDRDGGGGTRGDTDRNKNPRDKGGWVGEQGRDPAIEREQSAALGGGGEGDNGGDRDKGNKREEKND